MSKERAEQFDIQLANILSKRNELKKKYDEISKAKNSLFANELNERGLCLSVTRTWRKKKKRGERYFVHTPEWTKLKKVARENADNSCRFCGLHSKGGKWMVTDHIDGDPNNNSQSNLAINCPICDVIRHCGKSAGHGYWKLYISELTQVEIVRKTQEYWSKHGRIPEPELIDNKLKETKIDAIDFANLLMEKNYSQLNDEEQKYRGFFLDPSCKSFNKVLPKNDT